MFERVLDITKWSQTGNELKRGIVDAVKDTQQPILTELPGEILMTHDQFDMLVTDPQAKGMYDSKDFVYMTPLNSMEVRVKQLL